jgi:hypothetical protein
VSGEFVAAREDVLDL